MRKWILIALLMTCAVPPHAFAADDDSDLPADDRIKLLKYSASDVYTITTRYGYQTNLVFGDGEEIQTISVGDRSLWQIIPAGNRLFIRPMDEDVATNMTVLTNRHSYQFDLKSLPGDSKKGGNIYVARFLYDEGTPGGAPAMGPPPPAPPVSETPAAPDATEPRARPAPVVLHPAPPAHPVESLPQHRNYDYTFSGPDELAPLQVFDDGHSTYFKFRNMTQALPNAYIVNADGSQALTTPYVRQGYMVIDAMAPAFALKSSTGTVRVYNEMLNPK